MFKKISILFLFAIFFSGSGYLSATALTLYNLGPKAATLAGAFVGRADNATALYYNPAGLAFQKGLGFRVNVSYYNYTVSAESAEFQTTDQNSEPQLIGSFFVAYTYKERISIGVGAFTPYSLMTKWPSEWPGGPLCFYSKLNVFTIRPVLAIKINKYLSVGAGVDIITSNVRWDFHNIYSTIYGPDEGGVINELNASGKGLGFTAGILFRLNDNFQTGARYQQRVNIDQQGENDYRFKITNIYNDDVRGNRLHLNNGKPEFYARQEVIFTLNLPSEFIVGFMWTPTKKITLQADVQRTGWSHFKKWEFVAAKPEDSFFPPSTEDGDLNAAPADGAREGFELNMKDTWSFMLGGEYFLREELSLRIGYANHQSPLNEVTLTPVLPLLPRNVFSFGVGYDGPARSITDQSLIGNLTFDAYLQYVMLGEKTSSYPGYPLSFGGHYWVFGFGVGLYL
jgi:long-chain fatty acid transport protein